MRESPMLFSGALVRAILDGRKRVTRRPIRWPTAKSDTDAAVIRGPEQGLPVFWPYWRSNGNETPLSAPAQSGSRIWARETWRPVMYSHSSCIEYAAGGPTKNIVGDDFDAMEAWIKRSGGALRFPGAVGSLTHERWSPSIHMPRWAARLFLDVLNVRAEQLQSIDVDDIVSEGVLTPSEAEEACALPAGEIQRYMRPRFAKVWDSIYGKDPALCWKANPWVWRIPHSPPMVAAAPPSITTPESS